MIMTVCGVSFIISVWDAAGEDPFRDVLTGFTLAGSVK